MRRRLIPILLSLCLLCGCATAPAPQEEDGITIVATTYPIYLFASAVTEGVEDITVERLNTGSVSCLHDYTLSVTDMKKIEKADVIVLNGAGLEEFMEDALATSDALVIDCSEGVELLENRSHHHVEEEETEHVHEDEDEHEHLHEDEHTHAEEHEHLDVVETSLEDEHGHDHGHWDPHYWMDPRNACIMVENIYQKMSQFDPEHAERYANGATGQKTALSVLDRYLREDMLQANLTDKGIEVGGLITFHDGFQYFAHAYGLPLLESIEEVAGSEASAKEIVEITALIKEHDIPVIFTEVNGSDATANAIARETGCQVAQLSMCMDGPDDNLDHYLNAMRSNAKAVVNGFAEEEIIP